MRFSLALVLSITLVASGCGDDNDTTRGTGGDGGTGGAAGAGGAAGIGGAVFGDLHVLGSVPPTTAADMADRVDYRITCEDVIEIFGALPLEDDPNGPGRVVEDVFLDLPPVRCRVTLVVRDDDEAEVCSGSAEADVVAGETETLPIPLTCFGDLQVLVSVPSTPVTDMADRVDYRITCEDVIEIFGALPLEDDPNGPGRVVENVFLDLPEGPCDLTLTVRDDEDAPACTGSAQVGVVAAQTEMVSILLNCPDASE